MAKKQSESKEETSPSESTEIVEFDASAPPLAILPQGVDVQVIYQYGLDNDPFNQWEPELNESKLLQFRGVRKVHLEKQGYDGLLCKFIEVNTGNTVHKFLGEHVVREMIEKGVHMTGLPMLLTYAGKVRGRRREGQEVHDWKRYYYSAKEWATLTKTNGAK